MGGAALQQRTQQQTSTLGVSETTGTTGIEDFGSNAERIAAMNRSSSSSSSSSSSLLAAAEWVANGTGDTPTPAPSLPDRAVTVKVDPDWRVMRDAILRGPPFFYADDLVNWLRDNDDRRFYLVHTPTGATTPAPTTPAPTTPTPTTPAPTTPAPTTPATAEQIATWPQTGGFTTITLSGALVADLLLLKAGPDIDAALEGVASGATRTALRALFLRALSGDPTAIAALNQLAATDSDVSGAVTTLASTSSGARVPTVQLAAASLDNDALGTERKAVAAFFAELDGDRRMDLAWLLDPSRGNSGLTSVWTDPSLGLRDLWKAPVTDADRTKGLIDPRRAAEDLERLRILVGETVRTQSRISGYVQRATTLVSGTDPGDGTRPTPLDRSEAVQVNVMAAEQLARSGDAQAAADRLWIARMYAATDAERQMTFGRIPKRRPDEPDSMQARSADALELERMDAERDAKLAAEQYPLFGSVPQPKKGNSLPIPTLGAPLPETVESNPRGHDTAIGVGAAFTLVSEVLKWGAANKAMNELAVRTARRDELQRNIWLSNTVAVPPSRQVIDDLERRLRALDVPSLSAAERAQLTEALQVIGLMREGAAALRGPNR